MANAPSSVKPEKLPDLLAGFEPERVVPLRHPLRWVAVAVLAVLTAMLVHALVTEPGFQWPVVGSYLFDHAILDGVLVTLELTATAMAISIALGLILAIMRQSENPILSYSAVTYITFFRGVPTLVQLIFWFNLSVLFPRFGIGIPFGPEFASGNASSVISPLLAANLGLGLCDAAYTAEIIRGGLLSVDYDQIEASDSLGLTQRQRLRHIVLPQAMRTIIPPLGNGVIAMLKYTSLASVISVTELLQSAQSIYQRTFQTIPLLLVASIWYVFLTAALTIGQRWIERRFARGTAAPPNGLLRHIGRNLWARRATPGTSTA